MTACIVCSKEIEGATHCSDHDKSDIAKALMARSSSPNADRSKKRKYEVEKHLGQFMHGQGEGGGAGKTAAFRDGWERTFGRKREPQDFDEQESKR